MSLQFVIRLRVLGPSPEKLIDENRFLALKRSRQVLTAGLAIEELYEILLFNYRWLEQRFARTAVSAMVDHRFDYADFFEDRLAFNAELVNLLTSARQYVDQLRSRVAECLPGYTITRDEVAKLFSTQYDCNRHYRFMEALRNYVQHSGLPVDGISYGSRRVGDDSDSSMEYSVGVTARRAALAEDGKFKKAVLDETPERIDLVEATRGYVEGLSSVQASVREMTRGVVHEARSEIQSEIDEYLRATSASIVSLAAIAEDERQEREHVSLNLCWDDIRTRLESRNARQTNLSKRYVTTKIGVP